MRLVGDGVLGREKVVQRCKKQEERKKDKGRQSNDEMLDDQARSGRTGKYLALVRTSLSSEPNVYHFGPSP